MLNPEFNILCSELMSVSIGTESKMIIEYFKDVSAMHALISSVRETTLRDTYKLNEHYFLNCLPLAI